MTYIAIVWVPLIDTGLETKEARDDFQMLVNYWDRDSELVFMDPSATEPSTRAFSCLGKGGCMVEISAQVIPGQIANFYRLVVVSSRRQVISSYEVPSEWLGRVPDNLVPQFMASQCHVEPVDHVECIPQSLGFPIAHDPLVRSQLMQTSLKYGLYARITGLNGDLLQVGQPIMDQHLPSTARSYEDFGNYVPVTLKIRDKEYAARKALAGSERLAVRVRPIWSEPFSDIFPDGGYSGVLFNRYRLMPLFMAEETPVARYDFLYQQATSQHTAATSDGILSWRYWYKIKKLRENRQWLLDEIRERYCSEAESLESFEQSKVFEALSNSTISVRICYGFIGYMWGDIVRWLESYMLMRKCSACGKVFTSSDPRRKYCPKEQNQACDRVRSRNRQRRSRGLKNFTVD